ncbi:uncharacterized protein [Fopius arisanus]|nr:PREDICTED: uncharacterized protein LOC105268646 isoform X2 [Fopius arisanus]
MPGHRQPLSLEGLSLGRVCQQLDSTCRRLQQLSQETSSNQVLSYAKQSIRPYYVNSLPSILRTRVIDETSRMLYGPAPDGSTLISGPAPLYLLALLLGHDIKHLRVNLCCYYGCSHQTSLLKLLAHDGIALESLELARSALLRLDCKLLRTALQSMRNLRSLTLRNIANDSVLQVIGKSCPKLVVLDVACSMQVTDMGLNNLLLQIELRDKVATYPSSSETSWSKLKAIISKFKSRKRIEKRERQGILLEYCERKNLLCNTLKILNVANTSVTSAGVLLALAHVPHLESLADYNHMGRVVEIMNRGVIQLKTPFNLTQARSSRTTTARLELLSQTCPRLEKIFISEPLHPPEALRLFPYVTCLSLQSVPARKEWLSGFYDYLRTNGHRLRDLAVRITETDNPVQLDLRQVFQHCPNLVSLSKTGAGVVWLSGQDPQPLRKLRRIQLGRTVTASALLKILRLSPGLSSLHVHSCFDLTNGHLEGLLSDDNCLINSLNCFYVYEASKISVDVVLKILKSCGRLRKIGNLSNWGLDCDGVKILRETLVGANLDVDLCPGAHWFWSNCIH